MSACPCGSEKQYKDCCEPYLEGKTFPATPEALMRSRYTAYTLANIDYIQQTMKPPASNGFDPIEAALSAQQIKWQGLKIVKTTQENNQGTVEFIARYLEGRTRSYIHEVSSFHLEDSRWYYISGKIKKR